MLRRIIFTALAFLLALNTLFVPEVVEAGGKWPDVMNISYCWAESEPDPNCPVQQLIRYKNGTLFVDAGFQTDTGTWTYTKSTKTLVMRFDSFPELTYTGKKKKKCFNGTMENTSTGLTGAWSSCYN